MILTAAGRRGQLTAMRPLPALLVCLAACGGASTTGSAGGVGNSRGTGEPAGPTPTIAWSGDTAMDGQFSTLGLPAVSDDGQQVLLDWVKGDGARGFPNLRLVVRDRSDRTLDTRVVLDADEVEEKQDAVDVAPFNAWLAETNATRRWRPLTAGTVEQGEPAGDEMFASTQTGQAGGIRVRFDDTAHLVVEQDGKVVVDTVERGWLVPDHPMYEGAAADEICSNPIYLDSVHVDEARRLAVIGVEFRGNDSCWEPTGEYHVVAW